MKTDPRLLVIGLLLVVSTMVVATQFAITDIGMEYKIVSKKDYGTRYIGSDNTSDGIRVLRAIKNDPTNAFKIVLGNISNNYIYTYTAAFGIANEENFSIDITHIDVKSINHTYLKIWLHGNRTANAENISNDPTSVLMYDNGTIVNSSSTIAWTLAPGDNNKNTLCSNITDRDKYTFKNEYDDIANVYYTLNNSNFTTTFSDYVWVQVQVNVPELIDGKGVHPGTIYIYYKTE